MKLLVWRWGKSCHKEESEDVAAGMAMGKIPGKRRGAPYT